MSSSPRPESTPWLVSPAFDLSLLAGPALVACAVAVALPTGAGLPPWGWLVLVLGVDVAHVYASLYRTYADPAELMRRPRLYFGTPLVCLGALLAIQLLAPGIFWTLLAYVAVFHFIKQQWGFLALYRMRQGLPGRGWSARIEKWTCYGITGFPVLWWHVHLPLEFQWFVEGDFITGMPAWVLWPAGALTAAVALAHLITRLRSRRWSPGRDLWMLATAGVWMGGIILSGGDAAFTLTNVIAHGVPYVALVWWVSRQSWSRLQRGPGWPGLFAPIAVPLFLLPLLVLAFGEELLWDRLVWLDHPTIFGGWTFFGDEGTPAWLAPLAIAALSLPQTTHYVLDGFIWRMGADNPDLRKLLD